MYGVKSTSTFVNTVARQGVLSKQLVAAQTTSKTSTILTSLPSRTVPAKLSYTTSRASSQIGSTTFQSSPIQKDQNENHQRFQRRPLNQHSTQVRFNHSSSAQVERSLSDEDTSREVDARIQKAARLKHAGNVIDEFKSGKTAGARLSTKTYEIVLNACDSIRKNNQPLTMMLDVYNDMVVHGVQPTPQSYAVLIRSLCVRHSEVKKTLAMLRRNIARTGAKVDNLGELEAENNIDQAVALFEQAVIQNATQKIGIDVFNKMLQSLSIEGKLKDALYIYEQLEKSSIRPDSATFATLVNLFGNVGDIHAVTECFDEYKYVRRRLPKHDPSVVYNALVSVYASVGDFPAALNVVESVMAEDAVNVTITPYNYIISHACAQGNVVLATDIVAKLLGDNTLPNPNTSTYGALLSAHCRLGNMEEATKSYQRLLNSDPSKQFGHLADYVVLCTNQNKPEAALDVLNDMISHGMTVSPDLCKMVATSFLTNRDVSVAGNALMDLFDKCTANYYVDGNSPLVYVAYDILDRSKSITTSMMILQRLASCSVVPTPNVARAVVDQYMKERVSDQWSETLKAFDSKTFFMLYEILFRSRTPIHTFPQVAFAFFSDMRELGLPTNPSVYARIASRLAKYGDEALVERWKSEVLPFLPPAEQLAAEEHSIAFYKDRGEANELMTAETDIQSGAAVSAAARGRFDEAIRIIKDDIMGHGKLPTPSAVRDIIQTAYRAKNIDAAKTLYDLVIEPMNTRLESRQRLKALHSIYNGMMIFYARSNDIEKAKVFYNKLRDNALYPDADSYGTLLACVSSAEDETLDALTIYNEAKLHKVRPTVYFYNVILSKLGKCRKMEVVLELFEEMKKVGVQPNSITYATVISACARCSSENRAVRYFDEMISQPTYTPRISVYNSMIQFYVTQMPDRTKALKYFQLAKQYQVKPSGYTYKLLMDVYANITPYDMVAAHNLLSQMKTRHNLIPDGSHYATLIRSYGCLHSDVTSAEAVYREMEKAGLEANESVYQAMLNTYIDNDQMDEAERMYADMREKGKASSSYIENLFIKGYGAAGNMAKAADIFGRMTDDKELPGGIVREPSTYETMVKAYVENNMEAEAESVVRQMRTRAFPIKVLEGVEVLLPANAAAAPSTSPQ